MCDGGAGGGSSTRLQFQQRVNELALDLHIPCVVANECVGMRGVSWFNNSELVIFVEKFRTENAYTLRLSFFVFFV